MSGCHGLIFVDECKLNDVLVIFSFTISYLFLDIPKKIILFSQLVTDDKL